MIEAGGEVDAEVGEADLRRARVGPSVDPPIADGTP